MSSRPTTDLIALCPTTPVAHWMMRYIAISCPRVRGAQITAVGRAAPPLCASVKNDQSRQEFREQRIDTQSEPRRNPSITYDRPRPGFPLNRRAFASPNALLPDASEADGPA